MAARLRRRLWLLPCFLWVAACIPVPYKPPATVARDAAIEVSPTLSVQYLEDPAVLKLAEEIEDRDDEIEVVAHRELVAVAFPEGDITLDRLLEPDRRERLRRDCGLSYLVLLGDLSLAELSHHGGFIPLLGAGTATELANVAASVIDLNDGKAVTGITSTSKGWSGGVIYGFYGLFILPMTEKSAYDGVAKGVVEVIRSRAGGGPMRIAVGLASGLEVPGCVQGAECEEPASQSPVEPPFDLALEPIQAPDPPSDELK